MNIFITILTFIIMLIVALAAYALCRKFIFSKVRINKWIPLVISIIIFIIQIFAITLNQYLRSALSLLAVLFFLWFMDITQGGGPKKKEKQIVIKPKAKPNRVKKKDK